MTKVPSRDETGGVRDENPGWFRSVMWAAPTVVVLLVGTVLSWVGQHTGLHWFDPNSYGDVGTWVAATATVSLVAVAVRQIHVTQRINQDLLGMTERLAVAGRRYERMRHWHARLTVLHDQFADLLRYRQTASEAMIDLASGQWTGTNAEERRDVIRTALEHAVPSARKLDVTSQRLEGIDEDVVVRVWQNTVVARERATRLKDHETDFVLFEASDINDLVELQAQIETALGRANAELNP